MEKTGLSESVTLAWYELIKYSFANFESCGSVSTGNSLQRSQPLLPGAGAPSGEGTAAAGRDRTRVHPAQVAPIRAFCAPQWRVLNSGLGLLPWFSVQLQLPCWAASLQASLRKLGPVLSCSHLPPNYGPRSLPSVVRDLCMASPQAAQGLAVLLNNC